MRWWSLIILGIVVIAYCTALVIAVRESTHANASLALSISNVLDNKLYCGGTCAWDPPLADLSVPAQYEDTYSTSVARYCADLVERAYMTLTGPLQTPKGLTLVDPLTNTADGATLPFGAIWSSPGTVWIVYRGTDSGNLKEWMQDFTYAQDNTSQKDVYVHAGFLDVYKQSENKIMRAIDKYKPNTIIVTGHSLGAAVATVTALSLKAAGHHSVVYNFASPRVGPGSDCEVDVMIYRHVNTADIIPTMPPAVFPNFSVPLNPYQYTHCGKALYFTLNYQSLERNHSLLAYTDAFTKNLYSIPV